MVSVAIPQLGEAVAPCFEAATRFLIVKIDKGQVVSTKEADCVGPEAYCRIRLLDIHQISVLICNGIKGLYRDMLTASEINVIDKVSMAADDAIAKYLAGELVAREEPAARITPSHQVPHSILVDRARQLFQSHGYRVSSQPTEQSFLVDLAAEMTCPICNMPVRVAICCGAHTYRPTQEIAELHHAPLSGYNARVYISPADSALAECCAAYGIELIDPDADPAKRTETGKIPLLTGPVAGHERASDPLSDQ